MPGSGSSIPTPIAPAVAVARSRSEAIYPLVVFDLDGTLVDSAADLAASVNAALRARGWPAVPDDRLVGFIGDGARMLVVRSLEVVGADARDGEVEEVLAVFSRHYRRHCLDRTSLYRGIEAVLPALAQRGIDLAVLTNKPRAFAEEILLGLGVRKLFGWVVGGDDLPRRKPDPEGLVSILTKAGRAASEALLVGDSRVDLATARAARVDFCAVSWGFTSQAALRAAGAARVVSDPADLLGLIRGVATGRFRSAPARDPRPASSRR